RSPVWVVAETVLRLPARPAAGPSVEGWRGSDPGAHAGRLAADRTGAPAARTISPAPAEEWREPHRLRTEYPSPLWRRSDRRHPARGGGRGGAAPARRHPGQDQPHTGGTNRPVWLEGADRQPARVRPRRVC